MSFRKKDPLFCCALGGQDNIVSLWVTNKPMALIVIRNQFTNSILDLAWFVSEPFIASSLTTSLLAVLVLCRSPDGNVLLATSLDGTIGAVIFEDGDIGEKVSKIESEQHLMKLYGQSVGSFMTNNYNVIEDPSLFDLVTRPDLYCDFY